MLYIKDEGIVLRSSFSGSKDLSITVYFKTIGKENIYIKNGQIIKHPYLPVMQRFSIFRGVFISYKEKIFIKEIDNSLNVGYNLTKDLKKLETGFWILDIFDRLTISPDEKLYTLIKKSIYFLQFSSCLDDYKLKFITKYIYLNGVFPSFSYCINCKTKISKENFAEFSTDLSGSLCKNCSSSKKSLISFYDILMISKYLKIPLKEDKPLSYKNKNHLLRFLKEYLFSKFS